MRRQRHDPGRRETPDPVGVVLAGGFGRRIGGEKATVKLSGRPLISYPLEAMRAVLDDVAVLAKADTRLPSLPGVTLWIEPQTPRHPLAGVLQALALAEGRQVLVCAVDLPFASPVLIARLARADAAGSPAVVAAHRGRPQPLLARYEPRAASLLPRPSQDVSLLDAVAGIGPCLLEVDDVDELFNVNAPEDVLQAAAMLDRRRRGAYPNVKS
jgi:molybdopterin-guanine dinucleotide biosynthesis protein A